MKQKLARTITNIITSSLLISSFAIHNSFAATLTSNNANSSVSDANHWNPNQEPANNDTLVVSNGHNILFTNSSLIANISISSVAPGKLRIINGSDVTFNSITSGGPSGRTSIDFEGNNNKVTLPTAGNNYSKLSGVTFNDSNSNFNIANSITVDKFTFKTEDGSSNNNISISNNSINLTGNSVEDSAVFIGDFILNLTVDDTQHGRFIADDGDIDLNPITALQLNLTDNTTTTPPEGGRTYTVFDTVNDGSFNILDDGKVTLNVVKQNPLSTWSYSNGILTQLPNIQRLQTVANVIANGREQGNRISRQLQRDIMNHLINLVKSNSANKQTGVGAGDGDIQTKYGVWTSSFYSGARQSQNGSSPGYISRSHGMTVGFDSMMCEEAIIGAALSFNRTKLNHKDDNQGDITKINSYLFSLYGMQQLTDKWFLQGVTSYGRNMINNRELRNTDSGIKTAIGKYTVSTYGLEVMAGYQHRLNQNTILIPTFGLEYNYIAKTSYQETGALDQNMNISKKADNKLNGVVGVRLAFSTGIKQFEIIPEIHGEARYDLLNKKVQFTAKNENVVDSMVLKTAENSRFFINSGCGVTVKSGMAEYGLTYDSYWAKKYRAHQGSLKIRINF